MSPSRKNLSGDAVGGPPPAPYQPVEKVPRIRAPPGRKQESTPIRGRGALFPPSFAGRGNPPRTPPRRRCAPRLCPGDFPHTQLY